MTASPRRCASRALRVVVGALGLVLILALPAGAQTVPGADVQVDVEIGSYQPELDDWSVEAVTVLSAGLDEGQLFVIELQSATGAVLWAGQADWNGGPMRFTLDRLVASGDVEAIVVGQENPPVSAQTLPPSTPESSVAPTTAEVTTSVPEPTTVPTTTPPATTTPPTPPASVGIDVVSATAGGGSGGGTVTVSVILAIIVLALVFRLPMFAGNQPRWRK